MTHQRWDVQLTAYAAREWRANFFPGRHRALNRRRIGVGADSVAGSAAGGVGSAGEDVRVNGKKIRRNEPCVYGSGKELKIGRLDVLLAEERLRRDREGTRGNGQRDLGEHTARYGGGPPHT